MTKKKKKEKTPDEISTEECLEWMKDKAMFFILEVYPHSQTCCGVVLRCEVSDDER